MNTLQRGFYMGNTLEVAKALIGKLIVHKTPEGTAAGRIVETEAYLGKCDSAAHAYKKSRSGRTDILYGEGGHAYVFLIYGMYNCVNVVTGEEGVPECVLIRALEPVEGIDLMKARRGTDKLAALCSGPGKLCQALKIDRALYGCDLCLGPLYIGEDGFKPIVAATPRINIEYALADKDKPWRFIDKNSAFVSVKTILR